MNGRTIPLGRIFGIPVDLDRSWFLIFFLLTWLLGTNYYPSMFAGWPQPLYWFMGAVTTIGLFISVLLHELGHSVVAHWYRVPVHGITLFLFGGMARLGSDPPHARAEFLIAVGGPLVSLLLGVSFFLLQPLASFSEPVLGLTIYLAYINMALLIFNLIPGYPLDGGRVLRAFVWSINRDLRRATVFAAHAGRIVGGLFILYGVVRAAAGNFTGGIWIALIGWFLYATATQAVLANKAL